MGWKSILLLLLLLTIPGETYPQVPFGGGVRTRPLLKLEQPSKETFDSLLKEIEGSPFSVKDPLEALALYLLVDEGVKGLSVRVDEGPSKGMDDLLKKAILAITLSKKEEALERVREIRDRVRNGPLMEDSVSWAEENALIISTLLLTEEDSFIEGAERLLESYAKTFLNRGVATAYVEGKGARGDGDLRANVSGALAFYLAYRATGKEAFREEAGRILGFMEERLYDSLLGGFFLRNANSPYPPGEPPFVDRKPFLENALASYLIFKIKGEGEEYLTTINHLLGRIKGADYSERVAFLAAYRLGIKLPETPLAGRSILLLSILAFIAGVLSFLSPCTLPILPAYFAYTFQSDRKRIILMTFSFFLGLASLFSLMGATATFVGSFLRSHYELLLKIGGGFIILMGVLSFFGKGFSGYQFQRRPSATFIGSFLFGCSLAIGWTACVGPILAGILVLASTQEWASEGAFLLFIYALGLGLPLMVLSLFFHNLDRESLFWRIVKGKGWDVRISGFEFHLHSNNMVAGLLFIILGILMVTGYLTYLNRALPIEIQVWFADVEEWLLGVLD